MNIDAVVASYGRCCVNPAFFDRFYDIFLASNPAIKPMFAKTDFVKQKALLRQGISYMLMYLQGKATGTMAMTRLADSHGPKHLNINPALYEFWIDSLMKAVKECDKDCTPVIEAEWRRALRQGVDYMCTQGTKAA